LPFKVKVPTTNISQNTTHNWSIMPIRAGYVICNQQITKTHNQKTNAMKYLPCCSSQDYLHLQLFWNLHHSLPQDVNLLQINWNLQWLSFSKPILSLISKQYSSIYLSPFVNPNLGSSSQFFIIRTNLFKFSIPNQHLKPMINLTILKILSI